MQHSARRRPALQQRAPAGLRCGSIRGLGLRVSHGSTVYAGRSAREVSFSETSIIHSKLTHQQRTPHQEGFFMHLEIFFHRRRRRRFRRSHLDLMRMRIVQSGLRRPVAEQLRTHMRRRCLWPRLSEHRDQKNDQSSKNFQLHTNPSAANTDTTRRAINRIQYSPDSSSPDCYTKGPSSRHTTFRGCLEYRRQSADCH